MKETYIDRWLFNSHGNPIAFVSGENVFSKSGRFIGRLEGDEVLYGTYRGEICADDRLLVDQSREMVARAIPGTPGTLGIPGVPGSKGAIGVPRKYRDVDLDD